MTNLSDDLGAVAACLCPPGYVSHETALIVSSANLLSVLLTTSCMEVINEYDEEDWSNNTTLGNATANINPC